VICEVHPVVLHLHPSFYDHSFDPLLYFKAISKSEPKNAMVIPTSQKFIIFYSLSKVGYFIKKLRISGSNKTPITQKI